MNIPNRAACSSAFQKLELSKTLPDHFFLTYPYCYSIGQDLLCQQETFLLTSDSGWLKSMHGSALNALKIQ